MERLPFIGLAYPLYLTLQFLCDRREVLLEINSKMWIQLVKATCSTIVICEIVGLETQLFTYGSKCIPCFIKCLKNRNIFEAFIAKNMIAKLNIIEGIPATARIMKSLLIPVLLGQHRVNGGESKGERLWFGRKKERLPKEPSLYCLCLKRFC